MSTSTRLQKLESIAKVESHDDARSKRISELYMVVVRAIDSGNEDDPALTDIIAELGELAPCFDTLEDIRRIHSKIQSTY